MWYTVWRKLNSTTYRWYMAAEVLSVALSTVRDHSLTDAIVTKTSFPYSTNYAHPNDLQSYKI